MTSPHGSQTRTTAALCSSVALHIAMLLALAILVSGPRTPLTGPLERDAFIPITLVARRTPVPARMLIRVPHRTMAVAGSLPHAPMPSHAVLDRAPATRLALDSRQPARAANASAPHVDPPPPAHRALLPIPAVANVRTAPVAAQVAVSPSPIAASPAPAPATPVPAVPADYAGLFSQDYPPAAAAPAELAAIRGRIPAHLRIRIEVDDAGHATDVQIAGALDDPSVADGIRSALLALRYVPADCDGLHCDGVLVIDTSR
jgi:hypothetical protein